MIPYDETRAILGDGYNLTSIPSGYRGQDDPAMNNVVNGDHRLR